MRNWRPVKRSLCFCPVVEPDDAHANCGAVQNPGLVAPSEKYVPGLLDALQRLAVGASSDGVRRDEACALGSVGRDVGTGLLKPVRDEVSFARDASRERVEEPVDVLLS